MLAVHPHNLTPEQAATASQTHGLGLISDATSAVRTARVNGDRSLNITVPWNEKNANLLIADRLVCYKEQFYRITIPSRKERMGRRTITIEAPHVMYDLEHSYIVNIETKEDPETVDGINAQTAMQQVLSGSLFSPGTVDLEEKLEYLELLEVSRIEALEQVIDRWGGELVPDNWTLHLLNQSGNDRGLQIRVGKNISGIDCTEDISGVVTRLHVLGYQGANFESINGGKNYIDSPNIGKYAFVREDYVTFEDDEDPEELLRKGQEELDKRDKPRLTVKVDMAKVRGSQQYAYFKDLERADEGDTVTAYHEFLGEKVKLRVMELEEDCLTGDILRVTLGDINTDGLFRGLGGFVKTSELIKRILDSNGYVRTRSLRGEIDLLTTRLIASGSYERAEVIDGKGLLLENTNESSPDYGALYIGPGIFAIANAKNEDGGWNWRTFGTGEGFAGTEVIAGTVTTNQLSSEVGQSLDISSNQAIRSVVQQIDEAREELIGINQTTIEQASDAITLAVQQERARAQAVEDEIKSFTDSAKTYFRFDVDGLHIGRMDSPFTIVLSPEKISFLQDGVEVAFIMHNKLYINSAQILQMLTLGNPTTGYVDKKIVPGGEIALWRAN